MFWYNKTLVEFDLVQHQISFSGSSDVRLSFASPNITCPGKTNLMLDSISSNKCLMCLTNISFCFSQAKNVFEKFQKHRQANSACQAMFVNVCVFGHLEILFDKHSPWCGSTNLLLLVGWNINVCHECLGGQTYKHSHASRMSNVCQTMFVRLARALMFTFTWAIPLH